MAAVLEAKGLRVVRGERTILRNVSMSVDPGVVLGVLGPSGAGKSTLFRALTGELRPDAGSVHLSGEDVTRAPLWKRAQRGIGYIPQGPSVLWDLTVRENIVAFQRIARETPEPVPRAAAVGLAARLDVRAGELSAGERRRLEFARAISRRPKILVCDEPFAGVDPSGADALGKLLKELSEDGVAVVLADHHVAEALAICTRALLLLDGVIEVDETPEEFRSHPTVQGRYLGTWTRSIPPPTP
jgi:lipopolysaccharide export system ATP-binding protein